MHALRYILFADDDQDDRDLIQECCAHWGFDEKIRMVESGEELIKFLQELPGPHAYPSLIVLDMNMPKMNGAETLLQLKRSERFRDIPVVMYSTTSRHPEQGFTSSAAHHFFHKPDSYEGFRNCIGDIIRMVQPDLKTQMA